MVCFLLFCSGRPNWPSADAKAYPLDISRPSNLRLENPKRPFAPGATSATGDLLAATFPVNLLPSLGMGLFKRVQPYDSLPYEETWGTIRSLLMIVVR